MHKKCPVPWQSRENVATSPSSTVFVIQNQPQNIAKTKLLRSAVTIQIEMCVESWVFEFLVPRLCLAA
jgi:hypothetical protein